MPALDRRQIEELIADYAWALDATRPDGVASLFTANGVLKAPTGIYRGPEEIRAFVSEANLIDQGWQHWASNLRFAQSSENLATSECYVMVVDSLAQPNRIVAAGTYRDTLVYTSGRWLFSERRWGPVL